MEYKEIRETIEKDYYNVIGSRNPGVPVRRFYTVFALAIEELHLAVGPFVTDKEQFIQYIKNCNHSISKDVYAMMLQYCRDRLKLEEIGG